MVWLLFLFKIDHRGPSPRRRRTLRPYIIVLQYPKGGGGVQIQKYKHPTAYPYILCRK